MSSPSELVSFPPSLRKENSAWRAWWSRLRAFGALGARLPGVPLLTPHGLPWIKNNLKTYS